MTVPPRGRSKEGPTCCVSSMQRRVDLALEEKKGGKRKKERDAQRLEMNLSSRFAILVARGGTRPGYFYASSLEENGIMYFGSSPTVDLIRPLTRNGMESWFR